MSRPLNKFVKPKGFSLNDLVARLIQQEESKAITKRMLVRPETLKTLKRPKRKKRR